MPFDNWTIRRPATVKYFDYIMLFHVTSRHPLPITAQYGPLLSPVWMSVHFPVLGSFFSGWRPRWPPAYSRTLKIIKKYF